MLFPLLPQFHLIAASLNPPSLVFWSISTISHSQLIGDHRGCFPVDVGSPHFREDSSGMSRDLFPTCCYLSLLTEDGRDLTWDLLFSEHFFFLSRDASHQEGWSTSSFFFVCVVLSACLYFHNHWIILEFQMLDPSDCDPSNSVKSRCFAVEALLLFWEPLIPMEWNGIMEYSLSLWNEGLVRN